MKEVYLLDCTLRDGGYINNWEFGENNIINIIELLSKSSIDYIELGFLTNKEVNRNQSLYNSIFDAEEYIKTFSNHNKYTLMISSGKYDVNKLPLADKAKIKNIRYIYKKSKTSLAIEECKIIKEKGYNLFINPTYIREYSLVELKEIIEKVNTIKPFCFSIVDSTGGLKSEELKNLFKTVNRTLDGDVNICLHLHNNSSQAFTSAVNSLKIKTERKIIIDASIQGIGRGAGNLPIELIAFYMNRKFNRNYNISNFKDIYKNYIDISIKNSIFGLTNAHYFSAKYNCHPNYANYLVKNNIEDVNILDNIFKQIKDVDKTDYNEELIKNLLSEIKS